MPQGDWKEDVRDEFTGERVPGLKVKDGENMKVKFLDEGNRILTKFGYRILFNVEVAGEKKPFFVNAKNFRFLRQLKGVGRLSGATLEISRTGAGQTDTVYTVKKLR
jgi:hypothetical protein